MHAARPSSTAIIVASGLLRASLDPRTRGLVEPRTRDDLDSCLAMVAPKLRRLSRGASSRAGARGLVALESLFIPGLGLWHALRKRELRHQADALATDAAQLVVVGAGLDMLSRRLMESRPISCIEVDHPATQGAKARWLGAAGGARPGFLACDLARSRLGQLLANCPGFDPGARTLFVCEGVSMYLAAGRVDGLLRELATACAAPSTCLFTFMEPDRRAGGRPSFRRQGAMSRAWLGRVREPFTWGVDAKGMVSLAASCGWTTCEVLDHRAVLDRHAHLFRARAEPAAGERIAVLRRAATP